MKLRWPRRARKVDGLLWCTVHEGVIEAFEGETKCDRQWIDGTPCEPAILKTVAP